MNLEAIRSVVQDALPEAKPFVPGKTLVRASGVVYGAEELADAIAAVLEFQPAAGRWSARLERGLAERFGIMHARLVNSGSSANLLAVATLMSPALGDDRLRKGDEVITVACGFPTTVAPIVQLGLVPVFVDVQRPCFNVNVELLEAARDARYNRTRAVMLAHTLGTPFPRQVLDFCRKHNLWLIEDSCDAMGSVAGAGTGTPKLCGTLGHLATLSFYPAHTMTSLDAAERVLVVDSNHGMHWRPIGEFCSTEDVRKWRCVAFDRRGKLKIVSITGAVKHPCAESLLRVRLEGGRAVTVTASHSLFVPSSGGPTAIPTSQLRVGDLVYAPRILPCSRFDEVRQSAAFTRYAPGSWRAQPSQLLVSERLARFLGWYTAEGSLFGRKGVYNITFTLGPNEKHIAKQLRADAKRLFDVRTRIYKKRPRGWTVMMSNKGLFEFLRDNCGTVQPRRRVPPFLFQAAPAVRRAFLAAYFQGDGHHRNQRGEHDEWTAKTVSEELAHGVHALLLQKEMSPRYGLDPARTVSILNQAPSKCLPTHTVAYGTSGSGRANAASFRGAHGRLRRRFGDLVLLKVTAIKKIKPTTPYVYDLAVRGLENFVAGIGMIVHNTGEGGAVLCGDPRLAKIVTSLRDWGRDCYCLPGHDNTCGKRFEQPPKVLGELPVGWDHKYTFSHLGYNLKMTDMQAAIGCAQLPRVSGFVAARKANWRFYRKEFDSLGRFLEFADPPVFTDPSPFGFLMTVREACPKTRNEIVRQLEAARIQTRMLFAGNMLRQPCMKDVRYRVAGNLQETDRAAERAFWIGVWPGITSEMREYVVEQVRKAVLG